MILTSAIIVILVALWVSAAVHFIGAVFSARIRTQIATHPVLHGLWLFVALVLAAAVLWSSGTISTPPSKLVRAATNMAGLKTACESYRLTYDSFPSGDNAAITKALRGVNPRNIIFIELKSRNMNPAGEVIDPWGTPYRFKLENGKKPVVQSAGPDRVFETKDDLSSSSE